MEKEFTLQCTGKNCRKNSHRYGSRFCSACGTRLELPPQKAPEGREVRVEEIVRWTVSSEERLEGANLGGHPFFIAPSGAFWHVGKNPSATDEETELPLFLPGISKGHFLGIAGGKHTEPWAVLAWRNLVALYNVFSGQTLPVWQSQDPEKKECFRLPAVFPIVKRPAEKGTYLRILAVLRNGPNLCFQPFDLELERRGPKQEYEWNVKCIDGFGPIRRNAVKVLSAPFVLSASPRISLFMAYKDRSSGELNRSILEFDPRSDSYANPKVSKCYSRNERKYDLLLLRARGFAFSECEMFPPGGLFQESKGRSMFAWANEMTKHGQTAKLFEVEKTREQVPVNDLKPRSERLNLAMPSPIGLLEDEDNRLYCAFLNNDSRLVVSNPYEKFLEDRNMEKLDQFFRFETCQNHLWAINHSKEDLTHFRVGDGGLEYQIIMKHGANGFPGQGEICSPPVVAQDRVFYLRHVVDNHKFKQYLTLESVQ